MITRRRFLELSAAAGALGAAAGTTGLYRHLGILTPAGTASRALAQAGQIPLAGSGIPQFVDSLPLLSVAGGPMETIVAGTDEITLTMREFQASVMPSTFVPATGQYTGTWVWGYRAGIAATDPAGTYLGPVIVATRGTPTQIRYVNNLPGNNVTPNIAWRDWTDQTLHWADPFGDEMNMNHYQGPIPAVPHLHGGEVPPVVDGGPDSWYTSDGAYYGHGYYTHPVVAAAGNEAVYRYPNTQEAAPVWFHDHLLGGTRLNVYAGLAGAYPIIDPGLTLPAGLHPVGLQRGSNVDFVIPMVVQDRMFDVNGQLFFPSVGINPEHPFWIPEFEGNTIAVNGKVWPYLNVEPKRYRFLFINGSNARAYEMFLVNRVTKVMGPPIWQIATDGGYLDTPVKIDPNAAKPALTKLVLMPGERADVIVDFAGLAPGARLWLRNIARHPFPFGTAPDGATLGRIMEFRVVAAAPGFTDTSYDPASGIALRPPMVRLVNPATGTLTVAAQKTRQLTLNEVMGPGGPMEVLVNNTKWNGKSVATDLFTAPAAGVRPDFAAVTVGGVTEYYSELPDEDTTEVWEIINLTADAHPIHTHLTQFQLMNRQKFDVAKYNAAYNALFPATNAIDPMTGLPYPGGVFTGGFGPPADYNTGKAFVAGSGFTGMQVTTFLGGNPDVTRYLKGPVKPPESNEAGWKDTVIMYPGQVTRIAVRYLPTDAPAGASGNYPFDPNAGGHGFVWHCHIVDHEDNEMMRPNTVKPKPGATRTYNQGTDY